jgi:hypothetical protein
MEKELNMDGKKYIRKPCIAWLPTYIPYNQEWIWLEPYIKVYINYVCIGSFKV